MTIKQTGQIAATLLCAILAITMIGGCNHAPSDKTESGATTTTTKATSAPMSDGSTTASTTITTSMPTTSKKTTKKTTTTKKSTTGTTVHEAVEGDEQAVAERIIYYINKFRVEEGKEPLTVLPGLTEAAKRRAVQLTEKYEHNNDRLIQICTELKYRHYYEPTIYSDLAEGYYEVYGQEAIMGGLNRMAIDEAGWRYALAFRNSKAHWSYVGGADYKFIAVGTAYGNSDPTTDRGESLYACVLVAEWDVDQYPVYGEYIAYP